MNSLTWHKGCFYYTSLLWSNHVRAVLESRRLVPPCLQRDVSITNTTHPLLHRTIISLARTANLLTLVGVFAVQPLISEVYSKNTLTEPKDGQLANLFVNCCNKGYLYWLWFCILFWSKHLSTQKWFTLTLKGNSMDIMTCFPTLPPFSNHVNRWQFQEGATPKTSNRSLADKVGGWHIEWTFRKI